MSLFTEIYALKKAFRTYRNLHRSDLADWHEHYAQQLLQFKDKHKGEDCFILGNGPSLNKIDLTKLNDYYVFGMNKIYLIFDKVDLHLSYHLSVNPPMIEQSKAEFERGLGCPSFLSYRYSKGIIEDREHIFRIYAGDAPWTFTGDLMQPITEGFTITSVALQMAYFMGFKRVFLVGCDHNFKQTGKPNTLQKADEIDVNHFVPNYVGGQDWFLADLEGSEISYRQARYAYEQDERRIYDATVGGKLEVFPKISFEDALKMCKKKK